MVDDSVIMFVSFGWFVSVAAIFVIYVKMRRLQEDVKGIRSTVHLFDEDMPGPNGPDVAGR